jgi:hypothetical protein
MLTNKVANLKRSAHTGRFIRRVIILRVTDIRALSKGGFEIHFVYASPLPLKQLNPKDAAPLGYCMKLFHTLHDITLRRKMIINPLKTKLV